MSHHRLSHFRATAEAAARRRRIALWIEHLEHLERTPVRSDAERKAKAEAIELLRQAYPASPPPAG